MITHPQNSKLKQPKSLYLLFFTELWERFGFYTLQTILVLYMSTALLYSDQKAYLLYATFSALLYLMPVIGGYLADNYLGYQRAIIIGGLLFILSYLITAIPNEQMFFFGLSILICAHGLFKPNVSSIVGTLFDTNDPRIEGGFTLFYMGINVGALIPPLFAGYIVQHYGWHMGFILAALGMTLGVVTFIFGKKLLGKHGDTPHSSPLKKGRQQRIAFYSFFYLGILLTIGLINFAFHHPEVTNVLLEWAGLAVLSFVIIFMFREPPQTRNKMLAAVILIIISIGFWALYNQTFTSLMLFAERNMHKEILGLPLYTETTQFFNPFYIILLSPFLSSLWTRLARNNLNPSIPTKFAFGILCIALGFLILAIGAHYFSQDGVVSAWWLAMSYLIQTVGELLISPIGLAMITELSPRNLVGMMMGVWFFATSVSAAFSGSLAILTDVPKGSSVEAALVIYSNGFFKFSLLAFVLTVISFALIPLLKRMIGKP